MRVTNYLYGKKELKKLFAENGLHIGNVADKVGVARQTISNIMQGNGCSPVIAKKICDTFNVNMWDYFEMDE